MLKWRARNGTVSGENVGLKEVVGESGLFAEGNFMGGYNVSETFGKARG